MEELKDLNSLKDIVNIRFDLFPNKVAFIEKDSNSKDFNEIKAELNKAILNGATAKIINSNADLLWKNKYIFSFGLFNNNGKPEEAVLITGFKK